MPDSVAIRTGASFGRWHVIMGTADLFYEPKRKNIKTKAVIFDPGAKHHVMEIFPPVEIFAPCVDNSGNDTNVILSSQRPPWNQIPVVK